MSTKFNRSRNSKQTKKMNNTKFNKHNFWLRIIIFPLIFVLLLIPHLMFVFKRTYHFLRYGGEYINFEQNERYTLMAVYEMLKEIKENQKTPEL